VKYYVCLLPNILKEEQVRTKLELCPVAEGCKRYYAIVLSLSGAGLTIKAENLSRM
jgi:hypothetical protein